MTEVSDVVPQPPGTFFGFDEFMLTTNGMYGWSFSLAQLVTLTGLGWYDQDLNGLAHEHQLGIWQDYSTPTNARLIVSLTIPAGTNAPLDGVWRRVELDTPVVMQPGDYVVAGTHYSQNPDVVKFVFGGNLPRDPRVTIGLPALAGLNPFEEPPLDPFQVPDNFILVPAGVELGPNLFIVPINAPALQLSKAGNQVVLSWPIWATNFMLETCSDLAPTASWTPITNAVAKSATNFIQTNVIGSGVAFYRLRSR